MRRGALILAGGESRRMGTDKAQLDLGGRTFLDWAVSVFHQLEMPVWIALAKDAEPPGRITGVNWVHDEFSQRGPIEGIRRGLLASRDRVDLLFVTCCDAPLLRVEFVSALFAYVQPTDVAVVPLERGFLQPLCAIYGQRILPALAAAIDRQQMSLQALLQREPARAIAVQELLGSDPELDSLRNVNSPSDYQALLRELMRRAPPASSSNDSG